MVRDEVVAVDVVENSVEGGVASSSGHRVRSETGVDVGL
jgi:hypothetical protein